MAFKTRFRREPLKLPEITLVPLIDTALTLLIIFMVTAPMMRLSIKVDLPDSKTAKTTKVEEESLVVEMDAQGRVHFGDILYMIDLDHAQLTALKHAIARRVSPTNNAVFLFADRSLRYQKIVDLFDILSAIEGVQHVALVTQRMA
jgi:biopolymer transport protein TolR